MKTKLYEYTTRKTKDLIPYVNNSRTHSDQQVKQIASSIKEFGFTNPVLIDDENGVIAGHGRLLAAEKLKIDEVPCVILSGLTEAQKKAYVIADNQLALTSGWDMDMLKLEVESLGEMDFDIDLLGFEDGFLDGLLDGEETEGLTDPDDVPEVPVEPVTKLGDVWILGRHRLMCGDSTSIDAVELLMDGQKAQLLHADPPYGMGKEKDGVENDNLYREKLDEFQMAWWRAFRQKLEDNASAYIWGNAPELWRLWYRGGLSESERMTIRNEIVWSKGDAGAGGISHQGAEGLRLFPQSTERCLFFMLGEQGFNNNADNYWEGWEPIRSYLDGQMKRCGWTQRDLNRITGTQMGSHWVTRSQWALITAEHYEAIQKAAQEHDAFKREYDDLKREYDDLKREWYATRAFFDNTHDNMTDVWQFPRVTGEERHGHATPKPVAMMERVIKSSLPKGGLCIEPFNGSGSTLMAAEKTDRRCFAMELTPAYIDVTIKRWQDFTGQQAIHEETGKTFDELSNGTT